MPKKKTEHYVNNKELLEALIIYRSKVEKDFFEKNGRFPLKEDRSKHWPGKPPITNYLGECFLKIATHLSYKPNFINYTYREDMISDGIENCLQYVKNFNPEKSKNPFAYFTQIIYYAFLRRIAKEKKQSHVKNKMIERDAYDSFITMEGDDSYYYVEGIDTKLFLPEDDVYKPKKKESAKKKGLEVFMEDGDGKSVS